MVLGPPHVKALGVDWLSLPLGLQSKEARSRGSRNRPDRPVVGVRA